MPPAQPIALLFDLDETLIPETRPLANAYRAVAQRLFGTEVDDDTVSRVRRSARQLWEREAPHAEYRERVHLGPSDGLSSELTGAGDELAALRAFLPHYRRHAFDEVLPSGFDADPAALRELWWATRIGTQTVFDGARELLEGVGATHKLAMVTNGASDFQRHKIAVTGLGHHFDAIIVSGELGSGKPHAEPFLAALAALDVGPEQAVMIGNDSLRDISGAQRVGIRTIWIQPGDDPEPGAHTDLSAIPALVGK